MSVPIWAGLYIGLPFLCRGRDRTGLDCWGLVRLVLAEEFRVFVPSFDVDYESTYQADKISAIVEREAGGWQAVEHGKEVCGDVAVLMMRGRPMHVGIVMGDGQMLHIERGIDSVLEKYTTQKWAGRVYGFFRYAAHNER